MSAARSDCAVRRFREQRQRHYAGYEHADETAGGVGSRSASESWVFSGAQFDPMASVSSPPTSRRPGGAFKPPARGLFPMLVEETPTYGHALEPKRGCGCGRTSTWSTQTSRSSTAPGTRVCRSPQDNPASETAHPVVLRIAPIDPVTIVARFREGVRHLGDLRLVLAQGRLVNLPTGLRQLARPLQPIVSLDGSRPPVLAEPSGLVDEARAFREHERRVFRRPASRYKSPRTYLTPCYLRPPPRGSAGSCICTSKIRFAFGK